MGLIAMDAENITSVEDARIWAVDHDARVWALWERQLDLNKDNDAAHTQILDRLDRLERRIIWAAGAASSIGAIVGALGVRVLLP